SSRGADRTSDPPAVLSPSPRENALRTGSDSLDVRAQTDADDALMPDLPAPPSSKAEASEDALMPDLPAPPSSKAETDEDTLMPGLPAPPSSKADAMLNADADDDLMPALPPPRQGAKPSLPTPDADDASLPPLPFPSADSDDAWEDDLDAEEQPELPGIVIGTELQDILNVLIGDTVNLITPDGDLGPNGLIPRSRPYRVVGVFYTGFYLYDSGM